MTLEEAVIDPYIWETPIIVKCIREHVVRVISCGYESDGILRFSYKFDDETWISTDSLKDVINTWTLVDWFPAAQEENISYTAQAIERQFGHLSASQTKQLCNCDIQIIMSVGCKCGGS